jgi:hydrogenase maturation factor
MCLPLVAQVIAFDGEYATVVLATGTTMRANPALHPEVQPGAHVLVDRGLIVEVITAEQAQEIASLMEEIEELSAQETSGDDHH